ncbi:carbon storage regulator [Pseudomonas sp. MDT1-17]
MIELEFKIGQAVILNDVVEVRVLNIQRGYIKLGLTAPKSVNIVRTELPRQNQRYAPKAP